MCCLRQLLLVCLLLCSLTATARHDTLHICRGSSVLLPARTDLSSYSWWPTGGLDNPTIAGPMASPGTTTTYIVEGIGLQGQNLITNGSFDAGNTGFTSQYTYSPGANPTQGVYGVGRNANQLSPMYFASCSDHTSGTGPMMIVDGSPIAGQRVWCQTIAVAPQTHYAFSTWVTSILQPNPAALRFSINGIQLGQTFYAGTQNCQWRQFYARWQSGSATSAEICIVNQNTNPQGNDFALDDFAFLELVQVVQDTFTVVVHSTDQITIDTTFCAGSTIDYQGQPHPVSTDFSLIYTNRRGCDSVVHYRAQLIDTVVQTTRIDTLCPGETLQFYGRLIDRDTLLCVPVASATGCDTLYCLQAVFLSPAAIDAELQPPSCYGERNGLITTSIQAGLPPFHYRWSTGSSAGNLNRLGAGDYTLTVTDAKGCRAAVTLTLPQPPLLTATSQTHTTFCAGKTNGILNIAAAGGQPPYRYSIDGGQRFAPTPQFAGLQPGPLALQVTDANGCSWNGMAEVAAPLRLSLQGPADASIALGDSLSVQIVHNAPYPLSYRWLPSDGVACDTCATTTVRPLHTTLYRIQATDPFGCRIEAEWSVAVDRRAAIYLPTAFSPNGDGRHDSFTVYAGPGIEQILELEIYDRWGNLLYRETTGENGWSWDGSRAGLPLPTGTYVYRMVVRQADQLTESRSGSFLLLR